MPEHAATIVDDFLSTDTHTECSCGWVGENVRTGDPDVLPTALARHLAMADFAAHVHVALGLAVEDGDHA